ncbi:uncharacterized protein [Pyrus communis]|uniref:uncharacterized protein n=1 Tax=Pyrus communis TaxID=23211 RepID=UPI0035BF429E
MNPDIFGRVPPAKLAALCAHYSSKPSPSWLLDSGATSHITNDIANLSVSSPYTGEDKVDIGDGKGLSIKNIGSSYLHTPHTDFKLGNVLHVPHMKHNLLSAYQFLKDNDCSVTFDPDRSTVKDRVSGKTLLRGQVEDGFYPLQGFNSTVISSPSAFIRVKAPVKIWHRRLGHPSSSLFQKIVLLLKTINFHLDVQVLLQVTVSNYFTVIFEVLQSASSGSIIGASQNPDSSSSVSPSDLIGAASNPTSSSTSSSQVLPRNIHPMVTRSKVGMYKPKVYAATKHPLPVDIDVVPTTYLQASKHVYWRSTMQDEFNALQSTRTWTLIPPTPTQNVVGCKLVFRVKKKPDGPVDKFKARLVAKGFHQ